MDREIDREIELNEQRGKAIRDERNPPVVTAIDSVVDSFAKPLANQRPGDADADRQRRANDAEQRDLSNRAD
jgi:hypothetical protein